MSAFTVETLLAANKILQQENERLKAYQIGVMDDGEVLTLDIARRKNEQIADLTAKLKAAHNAIRECYKQDHCKCFVHFYDADMSKPTQADRIRAALPKTEVKHEK